MDDELLQKLYIWVDKIPFSRAKKNISRDFSDGVLMAEVIKYFFPKLVDVHNFPICNSTEAKRKNWELLNWKVFKKMNFELSDDVIEYLAIAKPGTIEKVLLLFRSKIERIVSCDKGQVYDLRPEAERFMLNRSRSPSQNRNLKKANILNNNFNNHSSGCGVINTNSKFLLNQKLRSPKSCVNLLQHNETLNRIENSDYIARKYYDEKVQDCFSLEETIDIYCAKLKKLENLLALKDKRINELQNKLNMISLQHI